MNGVLSKDGVYKEFGSYWQLVDIVSNSGVWRKNALEVDRMDVTFGPREVPWRSRFNAGIGAVEAMGVIDGTFYEGLMRLVAPLTMAAGYFENVAMVDYGGRLMSGKRHELFVVLLERGKADVRRRVAYVGRNKERPEDRPCTTTVQLSELDNVLSMHVTMRSWDLILGLPTDVLIWQLVNQTLARAADLELGQLSFSAMHPHIYTVHMDDNARVKQALRPLRRKYLEYELVDNLKWEESPNWANRTPRYRRVPAAISVKIMKEDAI